MSGNNERPIEVFGNSEMLLELAQSHVIRLYDSKESLCLGLKLNAEDDIRRVFAYYATEGDVITYASAFGSETFRLKIIAEIKSHLPVAETYMSKERSEMNLLLYELQDGRWVGLAPTRERSD